jgi:hypothetical protein
VVLVVDENVVETFASNRADETLDVAVRFQRPNGRANDPDAGTLPAGSARGDDHAPPVPANPSRMSP